MLFYKNNTSKLFSHLEHHHRDECAKLRTTESVKERRLSTSGSFARAVPLSVSSPWYQQLVDAIGMFMIRDLKPIAVVDGDGFCHLMKVVEPCFSLPS